MKLSESLPLEIRQAMYNELKQEFEGTTDSPAAQDDRAGAGVEHAIQAAERRNGGANNLTGQVGLLDHLIK
jgi:hypothetical protein